VSNVVSVGVGAVRMVALALTHDGIGDAAVGELAPIALASNAEAVRPA
jgi:hypothetical protein